MSAPNATAEKATGKVTPPRTDAAVPGGQVATTVQNGQATGQGRTQIADVVVSKIAGLATREIGGVYALGGGAARAFGAIRERIPGGTTNASLGVSVEVGQTQAAIDIDLVVEYGVAIAELAAAIRRNVIGAVERMTGLQVVEVNITVNDVHLPGGDDADPADSTTAPVLTPRVS